MKPLFFIILIKEGWQCRSVLAAQIDKQKAIDYGGFIMVLKMQLKTCSNIAQSPDGL